MYFSGDKKISKNLINMGGIYITGNKVLNKWVGFEIFVKFLDNIKNFSYQICRE